MTQEISGSMNQRLLKGAFLVEIMINEQLKQDLAETAAGWKRYEQNKGQTPSWSVAVCKTYCDYGTDRIKFLTRQVDPSAVATEPQYYYDKLSPADKPNFALAWGCQASGVLVTQLEMSPGYGWSTQRLLDDLNNACSGTPLAYPRTVGELVESVGTTQSGLNDSEADVVIMEGLRTPEKAGYFFQSHANLFRIKPLVLIFADYNAIFFEELLSAGSSITETTNKLMEAKDAKN